MPQTIGADTPGVKPPLSLWQEHDLGLDPVGISGVPVFLVLRRAFREPVKPADGPGDSN